MTTTTTLSNLSSALTAANTSKSAGSGASTSSSTSSSGTETSQQLNDRFLKLLVAQMNNQDPLNPQDSAQMTSQLAQINTVSGISGLNDSVKSLLSQFQRFESIQAAQLTGRDVMVDGSALSLSNATDATAKGGFELASAATQVKVEVRDANGSVVRTINLGAQGTGLQQFSWDGLTDSGSRAEAGSYTFDVKATDSAGKDVSATDYNVRRVTGVANQDDGSVALLLAGGGQVAYTDIKQIL